MTRRGSSAPGARPARRLAYAMVLLAATVIGGCGGGLTATPGTTATIEPGAVSPVATDQPSFPPPSEVPQPASPEPEPQPEPTGAATAAPEPDPATPAPVPAAHGSASACTGNDDNRDFYADLAPRVTWDLYCAVLPRGWNVVSGQYRLANGGRLEIGYRGPDGAGLMLQEGSFCAGEGDCVPPGPDRGATAFGNREGTLIATDDGWAVIVDRGQRPSWLLTVTGVNESTARAFAADLALVSAD